MCEPALSPAQSSNSIPASGSHSWSKGFRWHGEGPQAKQNQSSGLGSHPLDWHFEQHVKEHLRLLESLDPYEARTPSHRSVGTLVKTQQPECGTSYFQFVDLENGGGGVRVSQGFAPGTQHRERRQWFLKVTRQREARYIAVRQIVVVCPMPHRSVICVIHESTRSSGG
jgi:hypothetical protein